MAWKIVVPLGLLKYGTLTDVTVCYEYSFSIYAHMNPFSVIVCCHIVWENMPPSLKG